MTTQFFGTRWDAPAFDEATQIPVPVGSVCGLCEEEVAEGDSGTTQMFLTAGGTAHVGAVHIECWLRQGLGSPAHVRGACSCRGNPEPEDARTWREQGREVMRLVREGGAWWNSAPLT